MFLLFLQYPVFKLNINKGIIIIINTNITSEEKNHLTHFVLNKFAVFIHLPFKLTCQKEKNHQEW